MVAKRRGKGDLAGKRSRADGWEPRAEGHVPFWTAQGEGPRLGRETRNGDFPRAGSSHTGCKGSRGAGNGVRDKGGKSCEP